MNKKMKDIKLTDNEIYFLAYHMQKLWVENNSRYAKSIYDKAKISFDEAVMRVADTNKDNFRREYESQWVGGCKEIESIQIESPSNDEYIKLAEESNEKIKNAFKIPKQLLD